MDGYNYKVDRDGKSSVSIEVNVETEKFNKEKEKQLHKMSKNVELKGFRKGQAPKAMVESGMKSALYEETIKAIVPKIISEIVEKEELEPLGDVEYDLSKFVPDQELVFKVNFIIKQKVKLPDFSKIKVEKEKVEATTKEVNEFITNFAESKSGDKENKKKEFSISKLTDKWVKEQKIPDVKTVKELKKYVKEVITQQKEHQINQKYISDIINAAIEKSDVEVAASMVDKEVEHRISQDRDRIENLGLNWEDWLRQQKTSVEEFKKGLARNAEQALKEFLFLAAVAEQNKLTVSDEELQKVMDSIKSQQEIKDSEYELVQTRVITQLVQKKAIDFILDKVEAKKEK
jgi:FKBP-type peptidyl-prolyl cis-trans isomerase (trigger factor)